MQALAIFTLLISTSFGLRPFEATTERDFDNSVFSNNEEPSALPQEVPENKPTTGCFPNVPGPAQDVDQIKNDIESESVTSPPLPLSDPIPPQFRPYTPPGPFQRRFQNGFAPQPFVPQPQPFNNFIPQPQPFNSFGPQPFAPQPFAPQPFGHRNFYPFNRPGGMPFQPTPFSPFQRFSYPGNHHNGQPIVIVKLLQPIILPMARPMFPEGGERNVDDAVDSERYSNGFRGIRKLGRFGGERLRAEKPLPYRENTFGPYKVADEGNVHITVKLH